MKKTYKIEVDCANCANLMEEAAGKTEGVEKAAVNFMTQKMTLEFAEGADIDAVMKNVVKNCKRSRMTARSIFKPHKSVNALHDEGRILIIRER